jgi:ribokinase
LPQDKLIMMAPPKPRVVVVGAYNADLTIGSETPLISGRNVIGGPMRIFGGGRGANCAVAAARFGCEVSFVGAHGRDGFGGMAQGQLGSESINLEYFFELPQVKTGTTLSLVENMTAKHYMLCAESANDHLTPAMVRSARERILQADLVISELEISSDAVWETMELCQRNQIPFILDISPLERIDRLPDGNQVLLVVSDSIEGAMAFTKTSSVSDAIQKLHCSGCQNVVVVDDVREITYSDRQKIEGTSVPIERVLDRCGAIECLETWIGLSLIQQVPLRESCRQAAVAMAHSLARMGGHQGMPRRADIAVS